jgi:prepilin-type N-terminal cleavage/methylation domain-containing protein
VTRPAASQSGFSLLEMLVGLTLLALISVAVTQSVRTGLRLWQAAEANDSEAEWQQTEWLIERWMARALSPASYDLDSRLIFDPRPDGVTFLVDGQVGRKPAGYSRIGLAARPNPVCPSQADLVLTWEDVTMASSFSPGERDERVLFECADAISFTYHSAAGTAPTVGESATFFSELPAAISVRLTTSGKPRNLSARMVYAR